VKKDDGIYNDASEHAGTKQENVPISPFSVSQISKVFKPYPEWIWIKWPQKLNHTN